MNKVKLDIKKFDGEFRQPIKDLLTAMSVEYDTGMVYARPGDIVTWCGHKLAVVPRKTYCRCSEFAKKRNETKLENNYDFVFRYLDEERANYLDVDAIETSYGDIKYIGYHPSKQDMEVGEIKEYRPTFTGKDDGATNFNGGAIVRPGDVMTVKKDHELVKKVIVIPVLAWEGRLHSSPYLDIPFLYLDNSKFFGRASFSEHEVRTLDGEPVTQFRDV